MISEAGYKVGTFSLSLLASTRAGKLSYATLYSIPELYVEVENAGAVCGFEPPF